MSMYLIRNGISVLSFSVTEMFILMAKVLKNDLENIKHTMLY